MKVASVKKFKAEDLSLLYVDTIRKWAGAPHESDHANLASAIADELERRGKSVPSDEVKAETEMLLTIAIEHTQRLKKRIGRSVLPIASSS